MFKKSIYRPIERSIHILAEYYNLIAGYHNISDDVFSFWDVIDVLCFNGILSNEEALFMRNASAMVAKPRIYHCYKISEMDEMAKYVLKMYDYMKRFEKKLK